MHQPGRNPTRRNRNIGTARQGHGQDNRLVIPASWTDDRLFHEKLVSPVVVPISVANTSISVLVEPPLSGFAHACTVDDIVQVMNMLPPRHIEAIKIIALRQPKRKEVILDACWGRLQYWSEIAGHTGPAIHLEAQEVGRSLKWSKSLTPDRALELERLRSDGHSITSDKRQHVIALTIDSVRNTQLYRTIPHEVGHYVDYLSTVEEPSNGDYHRWLALNAKYDSRPHQEKEAFAHRYADNFREQQTGRGVLPFSRITNAEEMKQSGLDPDWFAAAKAD